MIRSHHSDIRALLREHAEGLTTEQILHALPRVKHADTIRNSLKSMPDAYIDRWMEARNGRGQYSAVWCVVDVPENCPHPVDKKPTKQLQQGAQA